MSSQSAEAPSGPLTRAERRKRATRDRILDAAGALFLEQGYRATTVDAICARADIARQTFFNHFAKKDDLLEVMIHGGAAFIRALVDRACDQGASTRERLALLFEGFAGVSSNMGPNGRELTMEVLRVGYSVGTRSESQTVANAISDLVRVGLEEGDTTQLYDVEELVSLVLGAFSALLTRSAVGGPTGGRDRAARMASLLADALERRPDEKRRHEK